MVEYETLLLRSSFLSADQMQQWRGTGERNNEAASGQLSRWVQTR